jgi:hypothetical protein
MLFREHTRFQLLEVQVHGRLLTSPCAASESCTSFWRWLTANGHRVDTLALKLPELLKGFIDPDTEPDSPEPAPEGPNPAPVIFGLLCDQAGLSRARAVTVEARNVYTLAGVYGLDNLVGLSCQLVQADDVTYNAAPVGSISLQPLVALTGLQSLSLQDTFCLRMYNYSNSSAAVTDDDGDGLAFESVLASVKPVTQLTALTHLELRHIACITSLDLLTSLAPTMQSLATLGNVQSLAPVSCFTKLTNLSLERFTRLADERGLAPVESLSQQTLRRLRVCCIYSRTRQPVELWPIGCLTSLQSLDISSCKTIDSLQPLAFLAGTLQHFSIDDIDSIQESGSCESAISSLSSLTALDLGMMFSSNFQFLTALAPNLERLSLSVGFCDQHDLEAICRCVALRYLSLELNTGRISTLESLHQLHMLRELELIEYDGSIRALEPLSALTGLQELHLGDFLPHAVCDVIPLSAIKSLRALSLLLLDHSESSLSCLQSAMPHVDFALDYGSKLMPSRRLGTLHTITCNGHRVRIDS